MPEPTGNFTSRTSARAARSLNFHFHVKEFRLETWNLGYASTNDGEWFEPLELLGVPASSIPFYSPRDFCETSLRLHSIRKLLSHPRDKASQFQRLPPRLTPPPPSGAFVRHPPPPTPTHPPLLSSPLPCGGPSLTRYITEPQNIDPGNCWFVADVLGWYRTA